LILMGERGWISRRSAVVAGIAGLALAIPAGAGAHPAYVDGEFAGTPNPQCADVSNPCTDIADAIPYVESGLAVIVDDSGAAYEEQLTTNWPQGNAAIVSSNFAPEPGSGATSWTIDGGSGTAVTVPSGETTTVSGFHLRGNDSAVTVNGPATIANNTFDDPDAAATLDVAVTGPGPTSIINNVFADTATPGDTAIDLASGSGPATLGRNTIRGYDTGVSVGDVTGAVSSSSDLLTGNVAALETAEDVRIENATFWSNSGADIAATDAGLTIDSSIIEDQINAVGASTCEIAFSRGPLQAPQPDPCDAFQTDDPPMFAADLHLQAGSPMIDAGNPAYTNLFRDIDGQPRALDGNGDGACPVEPDIGADEFAGVLLDCSPPPTPQPQPQLPDTTSPETIPGQGPSGRTKSRSATFAFGSGETGATFECRLDDALFAPCSSPQAVRVKPGKHTFEARARDAAGNADATPASWSWTVKKKKKKRK
jgi:hypothetical protein